MRALHICISFVLHLPCSLRKHKNHNPMDADFMFCVTVWEWNELRSFSTLPNITRASFSVHLASCFIVFLYAFSHLKLPGENNRLSHARPRSQLFPFPSALPALPLISLTVYVVRGPSQSSNKYLYSELWSDFPGRSSEDVCRWEKRRHGRLNTRMHHSHLYGSRSLHLLFLLPHIFLGLTEFHTWIIKYTAIA